MLYFQIIEECFLFSISCNTHSTSGNIFIVDFYYFFNFMEVSLLQVYFYILIKNSQLESVPFTSLESNSVFG